MKKKILFCMIIVLLVTGLTGCASFRKKFIRKKDADKQERLPTFYAVREYDIKPSLELYTKHYVFWKNWYKEFLTTLGKNVKKDRQCTMQMMMHLKDMQSMLKSPLAEELNEHIETLKKMQKTVSKGRMNVGTETRIRRTAENEYSQIRTKFSYNKVGGQILAEFKEEPSADYEKLSLEEQKYLNKTDDVIVVEETVDQEDAQEQITGSSESVLFLEKEQGE